MTKFHFLIILSLTFLINNMDASVSGDPGEIIAIKLNDKNKTTNNLTVNIMGDIYELIPLPFDKQGKSILINNESIYVNNKDFGESRIKIENTSMVSLSEEDSQRAYKESQIIKNTLNSYTTVYKPNLILYSLWKELSLADMVNADL